MIRILLLLALLLGCYRVPHTPSADLDCTACSGDGGVFAKTDRCSFRCLGGCIELQCNGDGGFDDVPLLKAIAAPP